MAVPLPGDNTDKELVFEEFGSMNVRDARISIKDEEWAWYENVMPIGKGNLRTLYAEGAALYTAPGGKTIVYYYPYNLGTTQYIAVFLNDGTAYQIRRSDGASTTISSTANTFYSASSALPACCQYESKYLLIVGTTSDNAYWIWNGSVLFTTGTLSPDVTITNPGSGYTSTPTVTAFGGTGSGATFSATINNGIVTEVVVTNPGSGYSRDDVVQLLFSGGGSDSSAGATALVNAASGGIGRVNIESGGNSYTSASVTSVTGGGGTGAQVIISGLSGGVVTEITVTNPGNGYTSAPTIGATVGSGLVALADMRYGQITNVIPYVAGSGYKAGGSAQIIISAPDQPLLPLIQAVAQVSAVNGSGGITTIDVPNFGLGYTKATVYIQGGNKAALGTANIMPYGVSGTTIETYQGHVWVGGGLTTGTKATNITFTAPASVGNFSTAAGGGTLQMTDSFLRDQVVRLVSNNGFLYVIGDSSVNVISNVQTTASGTTAATTFSNANVDPQVGTAWRDSVVAFQKAIVFANPTGVYALYGGAVQKVSDNIDTLFGNASFNTGQSGVTPTTGIATVFSIKVFTMTMTTTDPYSGTLRDIIVCWDGSKWFTATTLADTKLLAPQEFNSYLTSVASDTSKIYDLFQTPSTSLKKVWRSKLRADPSYISEKQVLRFGMNHQVNLTVGYLTTTIQSDTDIGNDTGDWPATNSFLKATTTAYTPIYKDVQNYGSMCGFTGQTYASDVTIVSHSLLLREYAPNV